MSYIFGVGCEAGIVVGADRAWTDPASGEILYASKLATAGGALFSVSGHWTCEGDRPDRPTWSLLDEVARAAPARVEADDVPRIAERLQSAIAWRLRRRAYRPADGDGARVYFWLSRWRTGDILIEPRHGLPRVAVASVTAFDMAGPSPPCTAHGEAVAVLHAIRGRRRPLSEATYALMHRPPMAVTVPEAAAFARDFVETAARLVPGVGGGVELRLVHAADGRVEELPS